MLQDKISVLLQMMLSIQELARKLLIGVCYDSILTLLLRLYWNFSNIRTARSWVRLIPILRAVKKMMSSEKNNYLSFIASFDIDNQCYVSDKRRFTSWLTNFTAFIIRAKTQGLKKYLHWVKRMFLWTFSLLSLL